MLLDCWCICINSTSHLINWALGLNCKLSLTFRYSNSWGAFFFHLQTLCDFAFKQQPRLCAGVTVQVLIDKRRELSDPVRSALKLKCTFKDEWTKYSGMTGDLMMSAALWRSAVVGWRHAWAFAPVCLCACVFQYIWHCARTTRLSWTGSAWRRGDFCKAMGWNSFYYLDITLLTLLFHFSVLSQNHSLRWT